MSDQAPVGAAAVRIRRRRFARTLGGLVVLAAVISFVVQNDHPVAVRLWWYTGHPTLIWVVVGALVVGGLVGYLGGRSLRRRRSAGRRGEREPAPTLYGGGRVLIRAVTVVAGELRWQEHPDPVPGPGDLLVGVRAAGVNAADLLQRLGLYPAPPGSPPDIPGMELAGEVVGLGPGASRFATGDRVMSLVGGGGQAEMAVVPESHAMAVPSGISWEEAGGFPEAFSTAYDALFTQCLLSLGERLLVTGAAGGVGIAAVQLAAAAGAEVVASVRRPELRDAVMALGAARAEDPDEAAASGPFDVVLELVGGPGMAASVAALGTGGRLSVIGVGAGARQELDMLALMGRRASVRGSTLRTRSRTEKELLAQAVECRVVPLLARGRVRVPLVQSFALSEAESAYERFAAGGKFGKIVLCRH